MKYTKKQIDDIISEVCFPIVSKTKATITEGLTEYPVEERDIITLSIIAATVAQENSINAFRQVLYRLFAEADD